MFRCTYFSKHSAVTGLAFALQYFAAAAGRIAPALHRRESEFLPGIKRGIFFPELHAGFRDHSQSAPLRVAGLHNGIHQFHTGRTSLFGNDAGIAVFKERFPFLRFGDCHRQSGKQFSSRESGNDTTDPFLLCHILAQLRSDNRVYMARVKEHIGTVLQCQVRFRHGLVGSEQ